MIALVVAPLLAVTLACDSVRVCAGGDVTLGTNIDTIWGRITTGIKTGDWRAGLVSPDSLLAPLQSLIVGADLVLVNAEGAFGDGPSEDDKCSIRFAGLRRRVEAAAKGTTAKARARAAKLAKALADSTAAHAHCFALRQPAAGAAALRGLGDLGPVIVANVANNHAHDAGDDGFVRSVGLLRDAGVLVTGADTIPSVAVTAWGDTVAVLGFSAWSSPGVNDLLVVSRLVSAARARYPYVIVTAHMGAEGVGAQRVGDSTEHFLGEDRGNPVAFAHAAVDAGAALVIGHGPHVLRASEWRDSSLIFYSLGNLLNYGPFNLGEPQRRGAIVCVTLGPSGPPHSVIVRSTVQPAQGVVRADSTDRARQLLDSLSALDFPRPTDSTAASRPR